MYLQTILRIDFTQALMKIEIPQCDLIIMLLQSDKQQS